MRILFYSFRSFFFVRFYSLRLQVHNRSPHWLYIYTRFWTVLSVVFGFFPSSHKLYIIWNCKIITIDGEPRNKKNLECPTILEWYSTCPIARISKNIRSLNQPLFWVLIPKLKIQMEIEMRYTREKYNSVAQAFQTLPIWNLVINFDASIIITEKKHSRWVAMHSHTRSISVWIAARHVQSPSVCTHIIDVRDVICI